MKVTTLKTGLVRAGDDLLEFLDQSIAKLEESCVVAVTSKIVSLAENRVVPIAEASKDKLIENEAELILPRSASRYRHSFTITNKTLISSAGIDDSNGGDNHILWPEDPQKSANGIREFLAKKFALEKIGVVITDSTSQPLRRGTTGIVLAYSGFFGLNNYIGNPDLFGRPFKFSQANIASGLAAAAVLAMGEGAEQTPLAILKDLPFVKFVPRNPSEVELAEFYPTLKNDLFAPFLENAPWQKRKSKAS